MSLHIESTEDALAELKKQRVKTLTAAISVVGTRLQINEDNRDYLAGRAIACAKDISRLLGWKSPFEQQAS